MENNLVYIDRKNRTIHIDGKISDIIRYYHDIRISRMPHVYQVDSIILLEPRGCELEISGVVDPSKDVLINRYERSKITHTNHQMTICSDKVHITIRGVNMYHPGYRLLV
jgi:hypothetical protein